jgi:hypothetical protein
VHFFRALFLINIEWLIAIGIAAGTTAGCWIPTQAEPRGNFPRSGFARQSLPLLSSCKVNIVRTKFFNWITKTKDILQYRKDGFVFNRNSYRVLEERMDFSTSRSILTKQIGPIVTLTPRLIHKKRISL